MKRVKNPRGQKRLFWVDRRNDVGCEISSQKRCVGYSLKINLLQIV